MAATAIRFYKLDARSLWLDEIFQAETAHLSGAGQVVQFAQVNIDQMPLFFFFTWFLGRWGDSAFLLRLPSAVIGVGAVLAVYATGARLISRRAGVVAAVLIAVMPYAVWYSQEARNYALLMLLTTLQMYFAYVAVTRGRVFDWGGLAVMTLLNLYNHYLAVLVTAGVIAFIAIAALFSALRPAPARVRVAAVVAVALIAGAALAVKWRPLLRSVYAYVSATSARHPRLSLIVAGLAVAVIAAALALIDLRLRARRWNPRVLRQLELATLAAAAVFLGYLPWLPYLRVFLGAPQQGIGRLNTAQTAHWGQLLGIGPRMGWSGVVAVAFVAGVVTLTILAVRGRALQTLLLGCWLVVPAAVLVSSTRWAIVDLDVRYLAWLFPGAVLVTAAGVEGALAIFEVAVRRLSRGPRLVPTLSAAGGVLVVALVLIQVVPALAAQYSTPKDDWRDSAAFIKANSTPGSMVISIGNYSDWAVICLGYYFRESGTAVRLSDGMQLTSDDVSALDEPGGAVWGVLNHPSPAQLDLFTSSTDETVSFVDVTKTIYVVRTPARLAMLDQARRLLRWEAPLEPSLDATSGMLDVIALQRTPGPNVVPAPETAGSGWSFTSGAAAAAGVVALRPSGSEVDATFTTATFAPGDDLLLAFDHRAHLAGGQQLVFAVAFDAQGHQLASAPSGAGYRCAPTDDWTTSYFALHVPAGAANVVLFFRASGSGTADFQNIQLSRIS